MNLRSLGDFLIIDLEATCWNGGNKGHQMEIIEIGVVLARPLQQGGKYVVQTVDELDIIVKPIVNPVLTPFCTKLTSITQQMIDEEGVSLATAITKVKDLQYTTPLFTSWGQFDQTLFMSDIRSKRLIYPFINHLNLKALFSLRTNKDLMGEEEALAAIGLTFEGTRHRAIDDAKNSRRLLQYLIDME